MNEMDLTAFRGELTAVVDKLDETGPVRLTKYNATVAEIRSATPEGDRQQLADILSTFNYLNDLDNDPVGGTTLVDHFANVGLDTLTLLTELADRHKTLAGDGVTFSEYPEHCLPDAGPITVDETLARLHFGDDYPESAPNPYEWFLACADIQKEATRRGMPVKLPSPNAYDEDSSSFIELAIDSGHTPASLRDFAGRAMQDGVAPERLAEMLGSEPIPADVLAMDDYNDWLFEQFTQYGLPHAEVVALFRKNLTTREAQNLVAAGIRTADEIENLIASGINTELALRARADGLTPEEWVTAVPKVQHLKYKGISSGPSFDKPGILPFRLLGQAADEKVSLVRWDDNALKVGADQTVRDFHADAEKRQTMYPWVHVYPDRVLDVARAGLSPSYITAFSRLMHHCFNDATSSEEFVTTAIEAYKLGLTAAMADAISRSTAKQIRFTPEQLLAVLRAGLADVGAAHYLASSHAYFDEWIDYLEKRRERQVIADAFVATVENETVWQVLKAAASWMKGAFTSRTLRGEVHLKVVIDKFLADKMLNDHELMILLTWSHRVLTFNYYAPKAWRDEHQPYAAVLDELARSLSRTFDQA